MLTMWGDNMDVDIDDCYDCGGTGKVDDPDRFNELSFEEEEVTTIEVATARELFDEARSVLLEARALAKDDTAWIGNPTGRIDACVRVAKAYADMAEVGARIDMYNGPDLEAESDSMRYKQALMDVNAILTEDPNENDIDTAINIITDAFQ